MGRSVNSPAGGVPGRIIFGGSFNPLHCGHMRLALECLDRLRHWADALEFLPASRPPHKDAGRLLPFCLRVEMIKEAIGRFRAMSCNEVESFRSGPSYTYETLAEMADADNLYFLMGSQDFNLLPQWHRGLELLSVANLVVVPRGDASSNDFLGQCFQFFGEVELLDPRAVEAGPGAVAVRHGGGRRVFWLPAPHLAISASYVRDCWLCGRSVDYLVPAKVLDVLNREERAARACWEGNSAPCSM